MARRDASELGHAANEPDSNLRLAVPPSSSISHPASSSSPPSPTLVAKLKNVPKRLSFARSPSTSPPLIRAPAAPPLPASLKVRFDSARGLLAKDRNGKSDPFIRTSLIPAASPMSAVCLSDRSRLVSEIRYATVDPVWFQSDVQLDLGAATLELIVFPDSLSSLSVKATVYDKDRVRNDYLGELEIGLADWLASCTPETLPFLAPENEPRWVPLTSSKARIRVTGQVLCKIGFLPPSTLAGLPTSILACLPSFSPSLLPDDRQAMLDISKLLAALPSPVYPHSITTPGLVHETEELDEKQERRVSKMLSSNKKLREIVFRKIRRKPSTGQKADEAPLVAVLSARPEAGVGTTGQAGMVTGPELSEAIGEESSDRDSLLSIISTDSESEGDAEMAGNLSASPNGPSLHDSIDSTNPQLLTPTPTTTLVVSPILSRASTSTSISSSKKLLSLPSTLSKKINPRSASNTCNTNSSASKSDSSARVRLVVPKKSKSQSSSASESRSPGSVSPTTARKTKKLMRLRKQKSEHSFKHGHLAQDDVLGRE